MTYLLDTNVLSETRKRRPDIRVTDWIATTPPERLHVSLTLGELEQGVSRIHSRGDLVQAADLARWLREVELGFAERILPVTREVAVAWGRQQRAQPIPVVDGLIAATAMTNGLTVVTGNVHHFGHPGVEVLNSFAE